MRRLTAAQYDRTVADLLGTDQHPGRDFPADDVSLGFDSIASVLSIAPLHLEMYERAARRLVDELFSRRSDDPVRQRLLPCSPGEQSGDPCSEQTLSSFALRAFRRPPTTEELARLYALQKVAAEHGETPLEGIRLAFTALLLSPHFIFRVEEDAAPNEARPLTSYEVATRLSFFLWGSIPDDALLQAAADGHLRDDDMLQGEVDRMLSSPKSQALTSDFAGQWLSIQALGEHAVDQATFATFDPKLRSAMQEEVRRFFDEFLHEDLPLTHMFTADFTYVNTRLAKHYQMPAVSDWTRVSLEKTPRVGLLGKAGVLTVTSLATRSSPVKRGKWVLEQLLCTPPPPPPPDVEADLGDSAVNTGSVRDRLEQHRQDPRCAACHDLLDPIGLGLEEFDAIGAFRAKDGGQPIDASGLLPDGTAFEGAEELSKILADDPRFGRCVTQQLLTFAIGRSFRDALGNLWTREIVRQTMKQGATLRNLIKAIVLSAPFRMRQGATTP